MIGIKGGEVMEILIQYISRTFSLTLEETKLLEYLLQGEEISNITKKMYTNEVTLYKKMKDFYQKFGIVHSKFARTQFDVFIINLLVKKLIESEVSFNEK